MNWEMIALPAVIGAFVAMFFNLAIKYWMSVSGDPEEIAISASLVGRFIFVNSIVEEIFGENSNFHQEIHNLVNLFDASCTSGNFDSEMRNREPDRCRIIEISAYRLVHRAISLRRRL